MSTQSVFFFFFLDGRREGDEMRVAWLTFRSPKSCAGVCLPSRIAPRSAAGESNAIVVQVCWLFSAFRSQVGEISNPPQKIRIQFFFDRSHLELGGGKLWDLMGPCCGAFAITVQVESTLHSLH